MAEKCPNSLSEGQKPGRSEATSLVEAWNMEGVEKQHLQPPSLSSINVCAGLSIYCLQKGKVTAGALVTVLSKQASAGYTQRHYSSITNANSGLIIKDRLIFDASQHKILIRFSIKGNSP